jgi:hypothetical protein
MISRWIVTAILLIHFALAVTSKSNHGTTSDEIVHLTGGLSYWKYNDYRLQPENGNLPQRWAAIPAWLSGASFPSIEKNIEDWRNSNAWIIGYQFFYNTGQPPYRTQLLGGRAMIALFSVATGLLIYLWSRRLFGQAGGLVSLLFYALCPNFLAHGALITSDACMTFFMLASIGAWWWHLHDSRYRIWLLSAVVFGLALVAKFSAVLLIPMFVLTAAVRALAPQPLVLFGLHFKSKIAKMGAAALSAGCQGLVAGLVIWGFYGFRYSAFSTALPPAESFIMPWAMINTNIGTWAVIIDALRKMEALPEAFLYGFSYVITTSSARAAYLDGDYSNFGWVKFFPLAFLYKSTVSLLVALPLSLVAARQLGLGRTMLYRFTPLLVLALIYGGFSLSSHLNIGHRHLLPLYPVLFITTGALGAWLIKRWRPVSFLLGALLAAQIWTIARVHPHYIAYFNEPTGGPTQGWRHLVDSSLDWGQDLPGVKSWIVAHAKPQEPIFMSYFGTDEPARYQFGERRLPFLNIFKIYQPLVPLEPGLYCINATMLTHVYSNVRGPWTLELEKEFIAVRALESKLVTYTQNPARRTELEREISAAQWNAIAQRYEILRFARLCYFLRVRRSEAQIGYSFFIYRLTAEEIHAATAGSLSDWSQLIERTATQNLIKIE